MNALIQSIQQDILNPSISLGSILLKAKALAFQLKNDEFKQWVKYELDGYPESEAVPSYRVLQTQSFGTFSNGVYIHSNRPIPFHAIPEKIRENVAGMQVLEGCSAIEEMASKEQLSGPWPGDWISLYNRQNRRSLDTYDLIEAHRPLLGSKFRQIIQTVRSRLQDFILEISDLPWTSDAELPPADQVERLVQVTIYNTAQGGDMATFDQRNQQVQQQYNAGRDINVNAIQDRNDFIEQLRRLKEDVTKAAEANDLGADNAIDAEHQIAKAIREGSKPEPKKSLILEYMGKAKSIVEGATKATGLATALSKLVEAIDKLF